MHNAIYDSKGSKLAGDASLPEQLPEELVLGILPAIFQGCLISRLENGQISAVRAEDASLKLLTRANTASEKNIFTKDGLLRALLLGQFKEEEAREACSRLHYIFEKRRIGISVNLIEPKVKAAAELLNALFDQGEGETLKIDEHHLALIYDCPEEQDDVIDLCGAIRESMNNELETDVHIGIGSVCESAGGLAISFDHAQAAAAVGRRISFHGGVWVYGRLFVEQILAELPREALQRQRLSMTRLAEVMDEDTAALLEELFAQNFNISKTARRMYMHRNTLIYRLDKLQKATGLDMRRFDDAVALRLFIALERLHK